MEGFRDVQGGLGIYEKGIPAPPKRDSVKLTHRKLVKAFREIGEQALNAADYERTRHLPVGRGRLACDAETGEFDPDAVRPLYNSAKASMYPRHVHSTITDGEYLVVGDEVEHSEALASRKWADKPLEIKKRFKLTEQDQLANMDALLKAERARGMQTEQRMEQFLMGSTPDSQDRASLLEIQLKEQKEETEALKAKLDAILLRLSTPVTVQEDDEDEDDDSESEASEEEAPVKRGRGRK